MSDALEVTVYLRVASTLFLGAFLGFGCGSSSSHGPESSGSREGGSSASSDSAPDPDAHAADDASTSPSGDASLSSCVPTIPSVTWKSPYAGWSKGISADPTFFPISVWLQGSWHAQELAQLGINIYLGNNAGTDTLATADLAILKGLGMHAIIGQDSAGRPNIEDPTIVGWWMSPDEPDNAQADDGGYGPPIAPSVMVDEYDTYRTFDPNRPMFLGLGQGVAYDAWEGRGDNPPAESGYVPASDIIDFDIYPYNNCGGDPNEQATCGQFWLNAAGVDRLHAWSDRNQAVWTDIETTDINAGSDAGPTPSQTRSEVWLALIHGANGITYFIDSWNPSFREDAIFENPTMVAAVTAVNAQITSLAPELNSANIVDLVSVASSNASAPLDSMVKANGTTLYVFAAISRAGTATGSFTIQGMKGNGSVDVVGEGRSIRVVAGKFSDTFAANDVHIYSVDLSKITCN